MAAIIGLNVGSWRCERCEREGRVCSVARIVTVSGGELLLCAICLANRIVAGEFLLIHESDPQPYDQAIASIAASPAWDAALAEKAATPEADEDGNVTIDDITVVFA